jgi:MipA family protein
MPRWVVTIAALVALSAPALASDLPVAAPAPVLTTPQPVSLWTVTIGAEGRVVPSFNGSKSYGIIPIPLFDVSKVGSPARFSAPLDGFGFAIFDTGQFQVGPSFKVDWGRRESSDGALRGLGNVDWTLEAGAFAQYWITPWLRARAELRQGIGGEKGLISDLTADVVVPITSQVTISGGPRMTLESTAAVSPTFSITQTQSINSGLPIYDAHGGVYSYGAGAQVRYAWSRQWAIYVFGEYYRLVGDPAHSPLVTVRGSRDQLQTGIGLAYSFDTPAWW